MFLETEILKSQLATYYPQLQIEVMDTVDSTNKMLKEWFQMGGEGEKVMFAKEQTAGVGRHGRPWLAPANTQLIFSLGRKIEFSPDSSAQVGWIPLVAGLALQKVLQSELSVTAGLKWPNDVQIEGKKIAGILVEALPRNSQDTLLTVIVGIGINLFTHQNMEHLPNATSVENYLPPGTILYPTNLAVSIVKELITQLTNLAKGKNFTQEYLKASSTIGKQVRLEIANSKPIIGQAVDIDEYGRLQLATVEGEKRVFSAGEITHLRNT